MGIKMGGFLQIRGIRPSLAYIIALKNKVTALFSKQVIYNQSNTPIKVKSLYFLVSSNVLISSPV
jgi:hypothetical protein